MLFVCCSLLLFVVCYVCVLLCVDCRCSLLVLCCVCVCGCVVFVVPCCLLLFGVCVLRCVVCGLLLFDVFCRFLGWKLFVGSCLLIVVS